MRPERFVTRKIIAAACRIASGSGEKLTLGNMDISRDWGWAPEYVEAMHLMLQQDEPDDYVIATGRHCRLEDFVAAAFGAVALDWREHVVQDKSLLRPSDIRIGCGNPRKVYEKLGWQPKLFMEDVVERMVKAQQAGLIERTP